MTQGYRRTTSKLLVGGRILMSHVSILALQSASFIRSQRAWQRPVPLVLSSSSYWKCNMKRELRLAATSGVWRSIASNLVHLNPPAVCAFSSKFYYNLNLTPNRCISVGLHSQHHSNNECYLHTVNENRNTAQFPPCAWTSHNVLT